MEKDVVVISGYLKFKAGLLNKWSTGFCEISKGIFTIYKADSCDSETLYQFGCNNSWISAKSGTDSGLFAINVSSPSKTFLLDAGIFENLQAWLQGFTSGGWSSAIVDKKLHYHRRSIDNGTSSDRVVSKKEVVHTRKEVRGNRDEDVDERREEKENGDLTVHMNGREDLNSNVVDFSCDKHASNPVNIDTEKPKKIVEDFDSHVQRQELFSHCQSDSVLYKNENFESKENQNSYNIGRCTSQPIEIQHKRRFDHSKIFFDPSLTSDNVTDPCYKPTKLSNSRARKSSLSKKPVQATFYESEESSPTSACDETSPTIPSRTTTEPTSQSHMQAQEEGACDKSSPTIPSRTTTEPPSQSHMQTQEEGACDKSSPTITSRTTTEPTSQSHRQTQEEGACDKSSLTLPSHATSEGASPCVMQSENRGPSDFFFGSSESHQSASGIPTASDSHERERFLNADVTRVRKSSSVASEGVADLNADVDGDSSVFTTGHHGTRLSYLESGYCSKESLATNESLDAPTSPVPSLTELKVEDAGNELTNVEASPRESELPKSDSSPNSASNNNEIHDSGDIPTIAITGRTFSDSKMTPRLARPSHMKMEKRSSMSQLLSQIKGKLPGRKTKSSRKSTKRENINFESSEAILWRSNGTWHERWISFHGSCLLLFKDSSLKTPDFALDVGECVLEALSERLDGYTCLKLVEKSGKTQAFAAATEDGYNGLLNMLKSIVGDENVPDPMPFCDTNNTNDNDEVDSEAAFQDAIVPYSEIEQYHEVVECRPNKKQTSVDSGNDGDVSCFEASDASTIGIDAIAAERRDKVGRRRKTSILLQRQPVQDIPDGDQNGPKTPVTNMQHRHKKVTYAESSPPTPTKSRGVPNLSRSVESMRSDVMDYKATEYLDVEKPRRMKSNRNSVPDFRKHTQLMLRHRSSCLEEVMKLKEAHENNQYPEKTKKIDRNRSTSWYLPQSKTINQITDENGNHQPMGTWDGLVTSSPVKTAVSVDRQKRLSESMDTATNGVNSGEIAEDFEEDLKQQTLLMKRRNSLRLRKDVVGKKVKHLKATLDKNKREADSLENLDSEKNLVALEEKLDDIEGELDKLNSKIDLPSFSDLKDSKKTTKQLFSKFKSNYKSSQNGKDKQLSKEAMEVLLTSPGLSPRLRKRSLTQNLRIIGNTFKRNSECSEANSNRESVSSAESSNDVQIDARDFAGHTAGDANDVEYPEISTDFNRDFLNGRGSSSDIDDIDGRSTSRHSKLSYEGVINIDGLLEIEEFEKFAVELAAKSFTECSEV